MKFQNIEKVAIKSILKNRMRSLLTSLGIIIGVCSVIVMVAIGKGTQITIEKQISSLGSNLLILHPSSSRMGGVSRGAGSYNRLTLNDYKNIIEKANHIKAASPIVRSSGQIIGGNNNWYSSIQGVSIEYITKIKEWELSEGKLFTERDIKAKKKVAVLGQTVVDELFPDTDPIGQKIRIRKIPFTVIGVLQEKGQNAMGQDQDDTIIAPYSTVLSRLKGGRYINVIFISANSMDEIDIAQKEIENIMRNSHNIKDSDDDDFDIRTQTEITEMVSATTKTLTLLLGAIAGISLIVGGIGIMNIMLVSVTERTREIGIRLSIGARSKDVLTQFLAEAITLSLIGGLIGIIFAIGISIFINQFTSLYTSISPSIGLVAVIFSGAVGIFFGYYPAQKAANLNPIEALRYE